MGYIVRMPQMGYEMDEGEVVSWEREEGEAIAEDEILVVVESEKATNEVESREDGTLRRIVVPEGGTVEPGTPIGIVAGSDEDIAEYEAEIDADAETATVPAQEATAAAESEPATTTAGTADGTGPAATAAAAPDTDGRDAGDVRATPGARRLAEEEGVDLGAIGGTGPHGVVTEDDVREHAFAAATATPAATAGGAEAGVAVEVAHEPIETPPPEGVRASPGARQLASGAGLDLTAVEGTGPQGVVTEADVRGVIEAGASETRTSEPAAEPAAVETGASRTVREARDLSRVQQTVSDRLSESYRNAVHVTNKRRFDASALRAVAAAADAAGLDVSMTDLIVKALGAELAARPEFNGLFEDGTHKLVAEVNVGVAVDVEEGLVTPVVPTVTEKSAEQVARVRGELTERAVAGEYTSEDLAGGTFTITNLGPLGVDSFDPVINPPEIAILGVGRVREDDQMTLSLSFDHRVVNGADAARFLGGLVDTLSDPLALAGFLETDVLSADGVDVSVSVDPDA